MLSKNSSWEKIIISIEKLFAIYDRLGNEIKQNKTIVDNLIAKASR